MVYPLPWRERVARNRRFHQPGRALVRGREYLAEFMERRTKPHRSTLNS